MASTVFGIELARRLGDAAIVVEADPGFVASDIWRNDPIMVTAPDPPSTVPLSHGHCMLVVSGVLPCVCVS
jgi:hypothetical protein